MTRPLLLLSGYLGRALSQVLLLWVFARQAGPAGAGEFAFALAVAAPTFAVFELALRNVYQTLHDAPPFRLFFTLRAGCAVAAAGTLMGASALIGAFPAFDLMVALAIMKMADSGIDICLGKLQATGRVGAAASCIWANTLLTVAAIFSVAIAGHDGRVAVWASAAASVAVLVATASALLARESGPWLPDRSQAASILSAGFKLGLAQALASALFYLPVLYLAANASPAAVGVFAVCQYALTAANLFLNSAMQTWLGPLSDGLEAHGSEELRRRLRRLARGMGLISLSGGVLTLAALPLLVPLAFGEGFDVRVSMAVPFSIAVVALGAEYAAATGLLVLNVYGGRVAASAAGAVVGLTFAAITAGEASVVLAGWMASGSCVTVALTSALVLRRAYRRTAATGAARSAAAP